MAREEDALHRATTQAELIVALREQLVRALTATNARPLPPDEIPDWLWNAAWARAYIAREVHDPSPFSAWRLGAWARLLPKHEQAVVLDRAIDAFEALIPTPIGPGNDAGPFCDIAECLSAAQAQRALQISNRMRDAGWQAEADAAVAAVAARLHILGCLAEASSAVATLGEDERRWFGTLIAGKTEKLRQPVPTGSTKRAWSAWMKEHRHHHDLRERLTDPEPAALLRALGGQTAVDLCRDLLTGGRGPNV